MDSENISDGGWNLMNWGVSKFLLRGRITLAVAVMAFGLIAPAYSQTQDIVLLLEQTPVKGGEITPAAGVHHFKPGSEVFLKAVPKPGYKFVRWLGEVSDATATSTIAYLNKPKVIIAVFEQAEHGVSADEVNDELVSTYMYTAGVPDPDLIIRTSGELRVSNFLIWQAAYSEWFITPTYWPDFNKEEYHRALEAFAQRDRRYGGVTEAVGKVHG